MTAKELSRITKIRIEIDILTEQLSYEKLGDTVKGSDNKDPYVLRTVKISGLSRKGLGISQQIKQKKAEAAAPVKAIAVATIPLGTVLASGTRCPQSGLWQCAAPNALGGDRRSFTAGETLPTVLIPASRSLIQKLKGDPQNQLAETTWTLIATPPSGETV